MHNSMKRWFGCLLAVVMGAGVKPADDLPGLLTSIRVTFGVFTVLCLVGIAASLVGPRKVKAF